MEIKTSNALSLVSKLASVSVEQQRQGVRELRLLTKWDADNRTAIGKAGAIPLLLRLLSSPDEKIQENAITALLNLSISPSNRDLIAQSPSSVDAILRIMTAGITTEAKENSAALLFSLMVVEDYRPLIGQKPGMVRALLDLVCSSSPRGRKDALKALFHISLCPENRPFVVEHGAIAVLASLLLQSSSSGVVEDALAVLAQALGCAEAVAAVRRASLIPVLVDLLDTGSTRAQENAASALLNLCKSGGHDVVMEVTDANSCISALSGLLSTGSVRAKNKASSLLQLLVVG